MYNFGILSARTGYRVVYREGVHCPGCGATAWTIGRTMAECGHCATALPLIAGAASGHGCVRKMGAAVKSRAA